MNDFWDKVEARGIARGEARGEANAMKRFLEMLNSGMSREEILAACRVVKAAFMCFMYFMARK